MRIAVIADIHVDLPALEAVLADIQRRGVDRTINLGDCVSGPARFTIYSWRRASYPWQPRSMGIRPRSCKFGTIRSLRVLHLDADQRHWLNALPTSADAGIDIFACHGTPTNDNQYLIEKCRTVGLFGHHCPSSQRRLGNVHARVVLCGHSYQQHLIQLPTGPLVLNPGSVGCPAYDDPGTIPTCVRERFSIRQICSTSTSTACLRR